MTLLKQQRNVSEFLDGGRAAGEAISFERFLLSHSAKETRFLIKGQGESIRTERAEKDELLLIKGPIEKLVIRDEPMTVQAKIMDPLLRVLP